MNRVGDGSKGCSTQDSRVIKSPGVKICEHFYLQAGHVLIGIHECRKGLNPGVQFSINAHAFLVVLNSAHLTCNGWKRR